MAPTLFSRCRITEPTCQIIVPRTARELVVAAQGMGKHKPILLNWYLELSRPTPKTEEYRFLSGL